MDKLRQDLRYSIRVLIKNPGFTVVAVVALAIGIGANTAIFSVINAVLLRPLPFHEPERLVWLWDTQPQLAEAPASLADYLDWRDQNQSFEHLAAFQTGNMFFGSGEGTDDVRIGLVTPELFGVLKATPVLGRAFTNEETAPGHFRVAVLGYSFWQQRFGGDPNVVGQTIDLNGAAYSVIGVLPEGLKFNGAELWRPLPIDPAKIDRGPHYLRIVGRLKDGVSLNQAQSEMSVIASNLAQQYPQKIAGHGVKLVSLQEVFVGDARPALLVLLGAVSFVLLIACANVANLLLARAASRQKEIAVRTALGASRMRIVRQLLTESLLLAVLSGALGILIAVWGVGALTSLSADTIPRVKEIGVDRWVAGFAILVSLATGVLFGLAPAVQASKPDLNDALKESGRTTGGSYRNRMRAVLVVSEIAIAVVLLIGAGLMIRSLARLNEVKPGFSSDRVLTMVVTLLRTRYPEDEKVASFYQTLTDRLAGVAGVRAAGAISDLPFSGSNTSDSFVIEGRPAIPKEQEPSTEYRVVTPNYFDAMGIPLLAGRDVAPGDTRQTPNVVVVNAAFAAQHFAGESAIGHRLKLQGQQRDPLLIIGVVGNVRHFGLDQEPVPEAYVPFLQDPLSDSYARSMTLAFRTDLEPGSIAQALRKEAASLDPTLPITAVKTMNEYRHDSLTRRRFNMLLLTIFACVALLLSAVGIYGVISYSVVQRTREIGIRVALGAASGDVLGMVVAGAARLALAGVAIGLAGAFALTRLMASLLYGVTPTDPLTFGLISLLLTGVALAASFVPARRAARVDPIVALRYE